MLTFFIAKKRIFLLLIISIKISSIISDSEKCYSIKNCETCPELDFCDKCKEGFAPNNPKTKCNAIKVINTTPKKIENKIQNKNKTLINNNTLSNSSNQFIAKPKENQVDPFKDIPFKQIEQMKQNDINRAKINKLLIIILIVLVVSIIISAVYDLLKKILNKGEDDDIQEESSKVVIH